MKEENLLSNAEKVGDYAQKKLKELAKKYESIGDVRGSGLFFGIELVSDKLVTYNYFTDFLAIKKPIFRH